MRKSFHSPDAETLRLEVDGSSLDPEAFFRFIKELQEVTEDVDKDYTDRKTRGRRVDSEHRRVVTDKHYVKFMPYPSRYANDVGNLRKKLYLGVIKHHCLVLQRSRVGRRSDCLYLLPEARARSLYDELDELNLKLVELNGKIEAFRGSADYDRILSILEKYDVNNVARGAAPVLHGFKVDPTPVRIDQQLVDSLTDERVKAEVHRYARELAEVAVNSIREELNDIIRKAFYEHVLKPEAASRRLEELRRLSHDTGLEALASDIIDPLMTAFEEPESLRREFGGLDSLQETVNSRIRAIVDQL